MREQSRRRFSEGGWWPGPRPLNVGRQISFAVAGEVDVHLARPEIQIQPRERNVAEMQIPLPCAHIHFQFQREVLAEVQIPIVLRPTEMDGVGLLRNVELAEAAGDAVLDARLVVRVTVSKVRIKEMSRAAVDNEVPGSHLQPSVCRLCSLQIHS